VADHISDFEIVPGLTPDGEPVCYMLVNEGALAGQLTVDATRLAGEQWITAAAMAEHQAATYAVLRGEMRMSDEVATHVLKAIREKLESGECGEQSSSSE
jgi:hypothetical protein